ncbi:putative S-layer protein [Paenibacillus pasadenensis]|uniref:Putative S-layer protein n=1 Tax=Paenibacillus pasadenensis TaxID=217090 RepID=A0A2N5N2Z6_9BACL|nr:transglutaminase domain-containing protein [Paenibacillus pasadenensis]PLT44727.1 putative S-layer protein [Paenibacillus pasadenensis]
MRHRIANLLLALSLAVSIYVVEARVGSPAQADGLAGTDAATVAAVEPGSGAVGFGKSQADAAEPSGGPAGAGAESVSESGPGQGAKPSAGSAAAGTPGQPGEASAQPRSDISAAADEARARLVDGLAEGFRSRSPEFRLTFKGGHEQLVELMPELVQQGLYQDDYTAYVLQSYAYKIRSAAGTSTITMTAKYRETPEQTAEVARRSKEIVASLVRPGMSEEQKAGAIHDWIVRHVRYDESLTRYTAYEALELRSAVCQGYALLAYRMLTDAGLEARIAEGTVDTGDHAWNLVRIDGSWHHMDTTWDDPLPDRGDEVSRRYYLLSDEEMRQDHEWTKPYPEAPESLPAVRKR